MTARLQIVQSISRLACTKCGAEANASCNCGVAYEVLAERRERNRQRMKAKREEEKREQNQLSRARTPNAETLAALAELDAGNGVEFDPTEWEKEVPFTAADRDAAQNSSINELVREVCHFSEEFSLRVESFLRENPEIPDDSADSLSRALQVCSDRIGELTKLLKLKGV